jgi:thiol-disulfide isomerase/thioredoxin
MRKVILATLLLVGCGGTDPMNRGQLPTGSGDYPLGPYGYSVGAVIANLQFQLKRDPSGATGSTNYSTLTPGPVNFSDFFSDKSVSWLVLTGAAGWCNPCHEEADKMPAVATKYEPMGVRFVTVLIQGYDEANQTPAQFGDVDRWQIQTGEHIYLGLDPKDNLHDFASEIASFPLNLLVRTSDMTIQYSALGVDSSNPSIEPVLQSFITN